MRWTKIYDIRELQSYRNTTALRLYVYLVMAASYPEATKRCTLASLAAELHTTRSAARHALDVLKKDGLIMQAAPHIIKIHQDGQDSNAQDSADSADKITDALTTLRTNSNKVEAALGAKRGTLHIHMEQFARLQTAAGKTWQNVPDLIAHFGAWYRKQFGTQIDKATKAAAQRQAAAKADAEYKAAQAAAQAPPSEEEGWRKTILEMQAAAARGSDHAQKALQDPKIQAWIKKLKL